MFKYTLTFFALAIFCAHAAPKPGLAAAPLAVAAPAIAPAYVTAQSSQVVARNFNALVAPVAPVVRAAPVVAAPAVAAAIRAPVVAAPAVAAPAFASPYVASPYYSPYYASPYFAAPAAPAPLLVK